MKKIKQKIAAILAVCFVCAAFAYAAPNVQTTRANGNISSVSYTFDLNPSNGLVEYNARVIGVSGTTSTYVATVIQRLSNGSWVNVPGTFCSASESGTYAMTGGSQYVTKGYWYRTQNTFIATKNGVQTKEVIESETTWYN